MSVERTYGFIRTTQQLDYAYRSDAALTPGVGAAETGSGFPELRTEDHVVQTDLRLEVSESVAHGAFHRWERSELDDYQQSGLEAGVIAEAYYLGHVDRDYQAHVVGATLQLDF